MDEPARTSNFEYCIYIMIDGGRPDVIEKSVHEGHLPNFKKYFFEEGDFRFATSVFPSTTGPAYAPILTGCYPGTINLPGIRWLDRQHFKDGRWNLRAVRSYVGVESYLMNRDLSRDHDTLFEILRPSMNIFSTLNRGVPFRGNKTKLTRAAYWLYAHYTDDWSRVDHKAWKLMLKAVDKKPQFLFVLFPGVDTHSHLSDPFSKKAWKAYQDVDTALGQLVEKLKDKGMYERTLIMASSDHGLSQTNRHLELWKVLENKGIPMLYHPKIFRKNIKGACMVSGNGMANLYIRNGQGWAEPTLHEEVKKLGLLDAFMDHEEIDLVVTRSENDWNIVTSRRGQARLQEKNGRLLYEKIGQDPFGFPDLPKEMTHREALHHTFDTDYPDALMQVAQIFRSPRAGDLCVSATCGFDLRDLHEWPEHSSSHGSLHKDHMYVPVLSNRKLGEKGPARTVDLFPTIVNLMGKPLPAYPIDGISLV